MCVFLLFIYPCEQQQHVDYDAPALTKTGMLTVSFGGGGIATVGNAGNTEKI
jgi:hypothetical protein